MAGKIKLRGIIMLDGNVLPDARIYIHIKGYSRAHVTHVDIESPELKKIILPHHSDYPEISWDSERVDIPVKGHLITIIDKTLGNLIRLNGNIYVGGKGKGIFLGFHKEQIKKLEEYGASIGIKSKKLKKLE